MKTIKILFSIFVLINVTTITLFAQPNYNPSEKEKYLFQIKPDMNSTEPLGEETITWMMSTVAAMKAFYHGRIDTVYASGVEGIYSYELVRSMLISDAQIPLFFGKHNLLVTYRTTVCDPDDYDYKTAADLTIDVEFLDYSLELMHITSNGFTKAINVQNIPSGLRKTNEELYDSDLIKMMDYFVGLTKEE